MPIDRDEARRIAGKAVQYNGIYCDAVADAILAAVRETAEECAAIVDKIPNGTPFLLDTAILKIRAAFGLEGR